MQPPTQPTPVQPVRSGVAAGLLGAMVLLSGAVAVWAGLQLLHGEKTDAAFGALPQTCEWVLVADDPAGLAAALTQASQLPQLSTAQRSLAARQGTLWLAATSLPGVDPTQPWAICGRPDGAVLAAVQRGGGVERFAWTEPGHDAGQLLAATLVRGKLPSLGQNLPFRTSLERVGGGQARLFLDAAWLRKDAALPPLLRDGVQHALWLGAALRLEGGQARLHVHVGTGPAGATWLKAHLDPVGVLDAAPLLDPQALAAGVVRVHPGAWLARSELFTRLDQHLRESLAIGLSDLAPLLTGHVVWQVLPGAAPAWLVLAQLGQPQQLQLPVPTGDHGGIAWQRAGSFLVLAATPALAQRGARLAASTQPPAGLDAEDARLLADSQGFFLKDNQPAPPGLGAIGELRGPLRCEALWLDTGFVAELSLPIPPTAH